jgi:hypothetical protein
MVLLNVRLILLQEILLASLLICYTNKCLSNCFLYLGNLRFVSGEFYSSAFKIYEIIILSHIEKSMWTVLSVSKRPVCCTSTTSFKVE